MIVIYLAGPDVFRNNAVSFFDQLKSVASRYKMLAYSPFDSAADEVSAHKIFYGNIGLIDKADVVIANLEPFRGIGVDDGTAFEIGYGYAKNKIIYGYTPYASKTYKELAALFQKHQDQQFPVLEDFDQPCNLMLAEAILKTGGKILHDFEECLKDLESKNNGRKKEGQP